MMASKTITPGLSRKLSRTSQYLSERIDGTKASKLDEEFQKYREKLLIYNHFLAKIAAETREFMHPHPVNRIKTAWKKSYFRATGRENVTTKYPYPEAALGQQLVKFGEELLDHTAYAHSLKESGKSFQKLYELKEIFETEIRDKFLNQLQTIQEEIQIIQRQLKSTEKRRLEYDHMRQNREKLCEDEVENCRRRLINSKQLFHVQMECFLSREQDHLSAFLEFTNSFQTYHRSCSRVMDSLLNTHLSNLRNAEDRNFLFAQLSAHEEPEISDDDEQLSETSDVSGESDELFCTTPLVEYSDDSFHLYLLPESKQMYKANSSCPVLPKLQEDEEDDSDGVSNEISCPGQ